MSFIIYKENLDFRDEGKISKSIEVTILTSTNEETVFETKKKSIFPVHPDLLIFLNNENENQKGRIHKD